MVYKKLLEFAATIDKNLKVSERKDGESFTHWSNDAPKDITEWFSGVTFDLCDHVTELDDAYRLLSDLSLAILECENFEELRERLDNNEYADIYNSDRLQWLSANLYRAGEVDDAMNEFGYSGQGIFDQIGIGQHWYRERLTNDIYSAMRDHLSLGDEF